MELAFWLFDPPPPIFRVLNSFFYIPWAHGTTRYMCQNGCFGGVFLVCQVMLTIERARNQREKNNHVQVVLEEEVYTWQRHNTKR